MGNAWLATLVAVLLIWAAPEVKAAEPITIGFSIELTGGLAAVGKTGLLAFRIWAEDGNRKGGLLGRSSWFTTTTRAIRPTSPASIQSWSISTRSTC